MREDGSKGEEWSTIDGGGWEHEIDPGRMLAKWEEEGGRRLLLGGGGGTVPTPKRKTRDEGRACIIGEEDTGGS